jgi:hypothetical protein
MSQEADTDNNRSFEKGFSPMFFYIASIVNHLGNVDVLTASSISVLITALAAMTEKANAQGTKLDIVVTFGQREMDPGQVAGMIDDALALNVVHRKSGHLYHVPMTSAQAEAISF